MRNFFCIPFLLIAQLTLAQVPVSKDLAVLAQVKKDRVTLRWAPATAVLWKAGNINGYRVERVTLEQYMEGTNDSARFVNATTIHPGLLPWDRTDARWKDLIQKNRSASFLYASLFSPEKKAPSQNKEMSFGMLMKTCDVQKEFSSAHGLMIVDSSFNKNEPYVYRISLNASSKIIHCAPALVIVDPKLLSVHSKIETVKAKFTDRRAALSFVTLGVKDYSGYWIERSEDSVNYQAVNKTPFIRTYSKYDKDKPESVFGDSLPSNNKRYYYRIVGINCFGEYGPPSNVVSGIGREAMREFPYIDSVTIAKNEEVTIKFHMPEKFDKLKLQGYIVYRSNKRAEGFLPVSGMLSPKSQVYMDAKPNEANYYKIAAYNIYGDSVCSMTVYAKLVDLTPPAAPGEPAGVIDSNGIVKLSWQANSEADLLGYRVYRCNSEREQPVELTKKIITQTSFRDSVNVKTLTREVFYTLRAVDKVHNNSSYSKYRKLLRPDKIKPIAVVFASIMPTDSSVVVKWHKSNSNDVKQYKLYRKDRATSWQLMKEINGTNGLNFFADTMLADGITYKYKMEVWDESGNMSSVESQELLFKPAFSTQIKSFGGSADLANRRIVLHWQPYEAVYNYTLYKARDNDPLQAFKTLPAGTTTFLDKELYPNHKYRYAIKATLQSGAETRLSQIEIVEF